MIKRNVLDSYPLQNPFNLPLNERSDYADVLNKKGLLRWGIAR